MKKALLILVISSLFLVVTGCGSTATAKGGIGNTPAKSDFNFIFKYGVGAKNILDTYAGTYTKDMVIDPAITIELTLSEEEMDSIYQKMAEIDFFNYPDEFKVTVPPGELTGMVTPFSRYYFTVEKDSQIKDLSWADEITNPNVKADKLRELINLIKSIIESKEEYKKLPEPSSGYL
jgi:hypothetical protein